MNRKKKGSCLMFSKGSYVNNDLIWWKRPAKGFFWGGGGLLFGAIYSKKVYFVTYLKLVRYIS